VDEVVSPATPVQVPNPTWASPTILAVQWRERKPTAMPAAPARSLVHDCDPLHRTHGTRRIHVSQRRYRLISKYDTGVNSETLTFTQSGRTTLPSLLVLKDLDILEHLLVHGEFGVLTKEVEDGHENCFRARNQTWSLFDPACSASDCSSGSTPPLVAL
jgi:hypothetical protein